MIKEKNPKGSLKRTKRAVKIFSQSRKRKGPTTANYCPQVPAAVICDHPGPFQSVKSGSCSWKLNPRLVFGAASTGEASTSPALMKPSHPSLYRPTKVHHFPFQIASNRKMFSMSSSGGRLALMRVSAGRSDAFRAAPSPSRGAELKQCATAFPRLGLRRLSVGALPPESCLWGAGPRK